MLRSIYDETSSQGVFWESTPLLLSLHKFNEAPEKDAQIRLSYNKELLSIPLPLLDLIFKNARNEINLPLIYQCWLASVIRGKEQSFSDIVDNSLNGIVIKEQAQALAAISQCWTNISRGESLAANFFGRNTDPRRRIEMAREQSATSKLIDAASIL